MNYENPKYKKLGESIIGELFPKLLNVKIAWLASDKKKMDSGRLVFADCRKVSEQYDWCCDYDFIITVYEPNAGRFDEEQLKILLEHELMHIGVEDGRLSIVPHDAEEFTEIIRKYGIDWSEPKCK
ncbi:MAG: hypothetical protein KBT15_06195 [Bacteroidales bacterium]|nr:hypothetical protein [Candidatus Minthousia equi]